MKVLQASCLFIILSMGNHLFAYVSEVDSLIGRGIDQSIRQNYAEAESTFSKIIRLEKNHPRGYFFLAAVVQSKMMDFETDRWEESFLSLLKKAEHYAKKLIKQNKQNAWAHFYLGSVFSYRAFYNGKSKEYISAIKYGLAGISSLEKAIKLDSTVYDAYFGIGSYKYWRSKLTRYFNWLPLISDERKPGIEMVKLSAQKGKYTKYAAINELTWILIDDGKVTEALKWAKLGLQNYPHSRFFLWGAAKSYYNLNQFNRALEYYNIILTSVKNEEINNHYNEIICYYKIAQCYFHLEQYEKSLNYCDDITKIKTSSGVKDRLNEIFKKVRELKEKIKAK